MRENVLSLPRRCMWLNKLTPVASHSSPLRGDGWAGALRVEF
jgi:hypothetical protein